MSWQSRDAGERDSAIGAPIKQKKEENPVLEYIQDHQTLTTVVVVMIAAAVGLFLFLLSSSAGPPPGSSTVSTDAYVNSTGRSPEDNGASGVTQSALAGKGIEQADFTALLAGEIAPTQAIENKLFFDINSDGAEEALILVRGEGERRPLDLYLFEMKGGSPGVSFRQTGIAQGEATFQGPRLVVTEGVYAQGDAPCCPTSFNRIYYVWNDNTMVVFKVESAPAGAP